MHARAEMKHILPSQKYLGIVSTTIEHKYTPVRTLDFFFAIAEEEDLFGIRYMYIEGDSKAAGCPVGACRSSGCTEFFSSDY